MGFSREIVTEAMKVGCKEEQSAIEYIVSIGNDQKGNFEKRAGT